MLAISFNFLNTPPAVRLAGWNIVRWLLRELSATRPKSPFSWASALILSNCRPGNESQTLNSSCLNRWLAEMGGISGQSENAQLSVWVHQNSYVSMCPTLFTSCLSNSFHQHRLANTKLHPQVCRTQLVQTQVHTAQQVICNITNTV